MKLNNLEKYYKTQVKFYDFTRQFFLFGRRKAVSMLKLIGGNSILDIGCGTGLNISHIKRKINTVSYTGVDYSYTGVDYSNSMLKTAAKKHSGEIFIKADVSKPMQEKLPHSHYDRIIAAYSVSMIDEWEKALINVKTLMHSESILIILDFDVWNSPLSFVYKLFRRWLKIHGVYIEKDVTGLLREHFDKVHKIRMMNGYYSIIKAEKPKI